MEGGQGESGGAAREADGIRGTCELAENLAGRQRRIGGGEDDLAGQSGGFEALGVVDEREAFAVAGVAGGHVGDQERPVEAEELEHLKERGRAGANFLHGDDIESADDLRD